jgi:hypothetical protein
VANVDAYRSKVKTAGFSLMERGLHDRARRRKRRDAVTVLSSAFT